mmetsp:Transcript_41768/g.121042  ORF Transcript_41768/g.121042 Transcript_41768/m.121042 type:complete len:119 (+) Transcript_41768:32-388(+)
MMAEGIAVSPDHDATGLEPLSARADGEVSDAPSGCFEDFSKLSVRALKQRLVDTGTTIPQGLTDKSELRDLAQQATARLNAAMGRDGCPLNLCPGSGDLCSQGHRRIIVEADFVTCTQ